jgi:hypothetical protein
MYMIVLGGLLIVGGADQWSDIQLAVPLISIGVILARVGALARSPGSLKDEPRPGSILVGQERTSPDVVSRDGGRRM